MKRNRPTARRAAPHLGLPISLAVHVAVIGAMLFSWSHKLDIDDQSTPVVPVDLVTLSDKTNIAPMTTEAPKPPEEQPQPQPPPQPPPPKPEELAPAPLDTAAVPKPAPPKPKFDADRIQALLDKRLKAAPDSQKNAKLGTQNIKGVGAQDAMTADLRSILQSEIYKCWSPPVGAPHPEELVLTYRLFFRRDGTIAQVPQLEYTAISADDPYMRAAVEAARRAIYTCAPYRLPADRYSQWQDVTFKFDPHVIMGQ
jgi:hypothetical protein